VSKHTESKNGVFFLARERASLSCGEVSSRHSIERYIYIFKSKHTYMHSAEPLGAFACVFFFPRPGRRMCVAKPQMMAAGKSHNAAAAADYAAQIRNGRRLCAAQSCWRIKAHDANERREERSTFARTFAAACGVF
jgi:hypothetical protein